MKISILNINSYFLSFIIIMMFPVCIASINKSTNIFNILMPLAFCGHIFLYIFFSYKYKLVQNKKLILFWTLYSFFSLFFLLLNSIAFDINVNYLDYLNIFIKFSYIVMLVSPFYYTSISKVSFKKFLTRFLIITVVICLFNIIYNYNNFFKLSSYTTGYEYSFSGIFPNKNQFAQFLLFSLSIYGYKYFEKNITSVSLLIYAFMLINVFLTFSRTGVATFSLLSLFIFYPKIKKSKFFVSLLILFVMLFIFYNSLFIYNTLLRPEAGLARREGLWISGIELLLNMNFLTGIGSFTAHDLTLGHVQFHSFWIENAAEGGFLYLFILVILYISVMRKAKQNMNYYKIYKASMICFFLMSLFESINILSIGYVDTIFTIFTISLPLSFSNLCSYDMYENL